MSVSIKSSLSEVCLVLSEQDRSDLGSQTPQALIVGIYQDPILLDLACLWYICLFHALHLH